MKREWTFRYRQYARVNGNTPDGQLSHDEKAYPGGKMAGYMIWIGQRWQEWRKAHGRKQNDILSKEDQASFDAYLERIPA